ncbi:MAG: indole-3-glycerol phosphate synthase TrpC [Nitrospirae bacterium]|nr:indole-3-glycerol phosphate synthase TrpC [Nitrospirota bacterium]
MSILDRITEKKRERLDQVKGKVPLSDLRARIAEAEKPRDFGGAVRREKGRIRLIAEIKQASPSRGAIRTDFDLAGIARIYEEKPVDAISVLTEEDFFCGDLKYIPAVKGFVTKPLLRKDFIFDEYQIHESRAWGADAILLIASLLDRDQAEEYLALCRELGLAVLFEVHSFDELEKALRVNADIIGINNRDLKTLTVDLNTTFLLRREIPPDRIVVSESGIKTRGDMLRLHSAGVDAVLVGTSLMEAEIMGKRVDELVG